MSTSSSSAPDGVVDPNFHSILGYEFTLPADKEIKDYTIMWIGEDCDAFANILLNYNELEVNCRFSCILSLKSIATTGRSRTMMMPVMVRRTRMIRQLKMRAAASAKSVRERTAL
jgi:hypothetical protein